MTNDEIKSTLASAAADRAEVRITTRDGEVAFCRVSRLDGDEVTIRERGSWPSKGQPAPTVTLALAEIASAARIASWSARPTP